VAGLAFLGRQAAWWGLDAFYWCPESGVSDLGALALDKTFDLQSMVVANLFSPVLALAGVTCLIGFLFFVLSFLFPRRVTRPVSASESGVAVSSAAPVETTSGKEADTSPVPEKTAPCEDATDFQKEPSDDKD
jgi:hypothetical protein